MTTRGIESHRPWPRRPQYLVGSDGSVIGPSGKVLRLQLSPRGYLVIGIWDGARAQKVPVHQMVAETWHGPRPPGHEVAHGNGSRTDNRAENLRWATRAENHADKRLHGTNPQGERQGAHRLTEDEVRTIRAEYSRGASQKALAERFDVSQSAVADLIRGRTWSHLPIGTLPDPCTRRARGEKNSRSSLTASAVHAIRAAAAAGETAASIAARHGLSASGVRHIVKRRVWRHVP